MLIGYVKYMSDEQRARIDAGAIDAIGDGHPAFPEVKEIRLDGEPVCARVLDTDAGWADCLTHADGTILRPGEEFRGDRHHLTDFPDGIPHRHFYGKVSVVWSPVGARIAAQIEGQPTC